LYLWLGRTGFFDGGGFDGFNWGRFRNRWFGFWYGGFDRFFHFGRFCGPISWSADVQCKGVITYFSTTGSGAFFGAGAGAKMLAQLFLTPSGMTLDVTLAAVVAVAAAAPVAVELQLSCAGFVVS